MARYPELFRDPGSHKGENGEVMVLGGSKDYHGAPALAGEAALRAGCDISRVLTSEKVRDVVAGYSEDLITRGYRGGYFTSEDLELVGSLSESADAVVVGPGLSEPDEGALREFASGTDTPVVVDADAIEPVIEVADEEMVFTPHRGEVSSIEDGYGSVRSFVEETGSVVLLKGPVDRIYTREGVEEVEAGNAAMTSGGTGDVLTGVVASLMSRGLGPGEAAKTGAWINGEAGELASRKYGNGVVATDLLEQIPRASRNLGYTGFMKRLREMF